MEITVPDAIGMAGFALALGLAVVEVHRRFRPLILRTTSEELLGVDRDGTAYLLVKVALINPSGSDRTVAQMQFSTEGTQLLIGEYPGVPDFERHLMHYAAPGSRTGTSVQMDALPGWPMDIPAGRSVGFYQAIRAKQPAPTPGHEEAKVIGLPLQAVDGKGRVVASTKLKASLFQSTPG